MPRVLRRSSLVLALAVAGGAAAGCEGEVRIGGDDRLSGTAVADALRAEYEARERSSGITLGSLTCRELDAEVGATLACEGQNSKEIELRLTGEVTAIEDGSASYRWRVAQAFAPGSFFARTLGPNVGRTIRSDIRGVRCPDRVELRPRTTLRCVVDVADGRRLPVTLLQVDGAGGYRWKPEGRTGPSS